MEILERVPLVKLELGEEVEEVLKQADEVLEYRPHAVVNGKLAGVLRDLDIQPYSDKSVGRYKDERLWAARRAKVWRWLLTSLKGGEVLVYNWESVSLGSYKQPVPVHVLSKALEIKRAWEERGYAEQDRLNAPKGRSLLSNIWNFDPIPPSLNFRVSHLTALTLQELLDPFLVVSYGDESYHIEVWDEPTFQNGRSK